MAVRLESAFSIPTNFKIHQVPTAPPGDVNFAEAVAAAPPPLGPPYRIYRDLDRQRLQYDLPAAEDDDAVADSRSWRQRP
jgi:hypothetical protein